MIWSLVWLDTLFYSEWIAPNSDWTYGNNMIGACHQYYKRLVADSYERPTSSSSQFIQQFGDIQCVQLAFPPRHGFRDSFFWECAWETSKRFPSLSCISFYVGDMKARVESNLIIFIVYWPSYFELFPVIFWDCRSKKLPPYLSYMSFVYLLLSVYTVLCMILVRYAWSLRNQIHVCCKTGAHRTGNCIQVRDTSSCNGWRKLWRDIKCKGSSINLTPSACFDFPMAINESLRGVWRHGISWII